MSTRKTNNSILVLATLGVYLGLVLIGATPQVLAQAAMTKQFNVKEEIEVKDNLDKKPPENFDTSVQLYLEDVEAFINALNKPGRDRRFDPGTDRFEVAQTTHLPCVANNQVGSYTAEKFFTSDQYVRPLLERFSKQLTDGYGLQDCLPNEKFPGIDATTSRFEFKFDGNAFSVEVAVKKSSPARAILLADTLAGTFRAFLGKSVWPVRANIIDNTSIRALNSQVLVVTRLPRAGLDALLASNAK